MNDLPFLGLTILFLVLSVGLLHALEGLREDKP
jgi:hypothetical protein